MKTLRMTTWQIYGIGGLVCLAVTLCAWCFLVAPAMHRDQEEREIRLDALERHRELPKVTVQLTLAHRRSDAVHAEIEKTRLDLQPISALNARLALLEGVANACGVSLDEVRPGDLIVGSHYRSIPIKLSGSAGYLATTEFLHRLRETLPDVALKSMELKAGGGTGKADAGTFHFELLWIAKT